VSAPADTLTVSLGGTPFRFAIFQTTTEAEGFDDVTFVTAASPVPALNEMALVALAGLLGLWGMTRLRRH
jgi:hypothetical protein